MASNFWITQNTSIAVNNDDIGIDGYSKQNCQMRFANVSLGSDSRIDGNISRIEAFMFQRWMALLSIIPDFLW